jgi:hypothetical protein
VLLRNLDVNKDAVNRPIVHTLSSHSNYGAANMARVGLRPMTPCTSGAIHPGNEARRFPNETDEKVISQPAENVKVVLTEKRKNCTLAVLELMGGSRPTQRKDSHFHG